MYFRDWLVLHEGSFKEDDIPPYFYIAINFSQDLVGRYPFTPSGAICTLVNAEGVSESPDILNSFFSNANLALQMPGKAFVRLNRVSKALYDNPSYNASVGFRSPRRLGSGIGARITRENYMLKIVNEIIHRILDTRKSLKPSDDNYDYSDRRLQHEGGTISAKEIVAGLKQLKPVRGVQYGKERPQKRIWGTTRETGVKNIKPHLKAHHGDNLYNIKGVSDLANRLVYVLRGVPDIESLLLGKVSDQPNAKTWIQDNLEKITADKTGYKHEAEWFVKRSHVRASVVKCGNCGFENTVPPNVPDDVIRCRKCNVKISLNSPNTEPSVRVVNKNLLNVPDGSILYVGKSILSGERLPDSVRDYISDWQKKNPGTNNVHSFIKAYGLDKKFKIHIVENGHEARSIAVDVKKASPYDPEKSDIQGTVFAAIKKGINNVEMLLKFIKHKYGMEPGKVVAYLNKWKKSGVIDIENGKISIKNPDYNELHEQVYELLHGSLNDLSNEEIASDVGLSKEQVKEILLSLEKKGRAVAIGEKWRIKFNEEEKEQFNDKEKDILDCIERNPHAGRYTVKECSSIESDAEFDMYMRLLKLKDKAFIGKIHGLINGMPKEMTDIEKDLLHYLKKSLILICIPFITIKNMKTLA